MGIHDVRTMNIFGKQWMFWILAFFFTEKGWDIGTGLAAERTRLRKTMQRSATIGFFNDTGAMPLKGWGLWFHQAWLRQPKIDRRYRCACCFGSAELGSVRVEDQVLVWSSWLIIISMTCFRPFIRMKKLAGLVKRSGLQPWICSFRVWPSCNWVKSLCGQDWWRQVWWEITPLDRERVWIPYNAPDFVNQVNWDLVSQNKESIACRRQSPWRQVFLS